MKVVFICQGYRCELGKSLTTDHPVTLAPRYVTHHLTVNWIWFPAQICANMQYTLVIISLGITLIVVTMIKIIVKHLHKCMSTIKLSSFCHFTNILGTAGTGGDNEVVKVYEKTFLDITCTFVDKSASNMYHVSIDAIKSEAKIDFK